MTSTIIVPRAGLKPTPAKGGANVALVTQGDTCTELATWCEVVMTSGPSAGKRGWLPPAAIMPAVAPPALGIYAINKSEDQWRDSWASEQKILTGSVPAIMHVFKPWSLTAPEGGWWGAWDSAWADDALANGAMPMITWEGRDLSVSGATPQPKYSNASVLSGVWDATFISFLDAVRAWGKPIIIRLDHEGNGLWYPWAAGANGNTRESAIAAFRYKSRLIRARAPNARILWTPGTVGKDWLPLEDCYPGAAYVDYLGCDYYNTITQAGGQWLEFADIRPFYDRLCALEPTKHIIVAETGSVPAPGHNKAAWYAAIPSACAALPRITAVVAFDQTDGPLDFRVSADPTVFGTWKALCSASGRLP